MLTEKILNEKLDSVDFKDVMESLYNRDHGMYVQFYMDNKSNIQFFEIQQNSYQSLNDDETGIASLVCDWDISMVHQDAEYDEEKDDHYFDDNGRKIYSEDWVGWTLANADLDDDIDHLKDRIIKEWKFKEEINSLDNS